MFILLSSVLKEFLFDFFASKEKKKILKIIIYIYLCLSGDTAPEKSFNEVSDLINKMKRKQSR